MPDYSDWTIFLDRDGVINRRLPDDYVRHFSQFDFLPGVLEAIATLATVFVRIFIVTNQQGIGKGLMTEKELEAIHHAMLAEIIQADGRIDKIYYCPHLASEDCQCRKPLPGMALQAVMNFPEVDFGRSIMAGDTESDMRFGANLGMKTALIGEEPMQQITPDLRFPNLLQLATYFQSGVKDNKGKQ